MTTDEKPRLILGCFRPVDLARLLLVVLPSVPGLLFLAVGFVLEAYQHRSQEDTTATRAERAHTAWQVRELYLVGAVTLCVGTLGMAAVIWKIARTHPEEEDDTPDSGRDGSPSRP